MLIHLKQFIRSPFFPIFMIVFVDVLGFAITIPVLPLYVQDEFGGTAVQITALTTFYFATQLIAMPGLGRLSDRVGRRPVLIISQFGTFLALLLSALAPSLIYLYAARIIDGLTGGNISVAQAYLSDVTDKHNRTKGMGIINAAFSSSLLIGPAFGSLVAARFGPRLPFAAAAALSLLTILLSYTLLPKAQKSAPSTGQARPKNLKALLLLPGMLLLLALALGDRIAFLTFQPTWVLWMEHILFAGRDLATVQRAAGWLLTLTGAAGIITQIALVGPLTKKLGEKWMIIVGTGMRAFAWGMMALFPFLAPTLLAAPLIGMGGGIGLPALTALITYAAPPEQQGYAIGLMQASKGIGRIIGSTMGGVVFQYIAPSATLTTSALISATLLVVMLRLPKREA